MPPRRSPALTADQLTSARLAYESGTTYRELGARFGISHDTIRRMLTAVGVTSRPVGFQPQPEPQPRPVVVDIVRQPGRPLMIPCRTPGERLLRRWTPPEIEAITHELVAGRFQRVRKGHSGLPERMTVRDYQAASIAFHAALRRAA